MRLLILSCSATKADHPARAIDLYDGPAFRTLRAWMRSASTSELQELAVWVLSAEHGLIPFDFELEPYDRRMTIARAGELLGAVRDKLHDLVEEMQPAEAFLMMGREYLAAIGPITPFAFGPAEVEFPEGGIGDKLGELHRWLRQEVA